MTPELVPQHPELATYGQASLSTRVAIANKVIGRAGHGGEPREICEEGGDCGEGAESDAGGRGARGAREDGQDARRRRQQEGRRWSRFRPSDAMKLLNQEKRKRSHSGDTDFVS